MTSLNLQDNELLVRAKATAKTLPEQERVARQRVADGDVAYKAVSAELRRGRVRHLVGRISDKDLAALQKAKDQAAARLETANKALAEIVEQRDVLAEVLPHAEAEAKDELAPKLRAAARAEAQRFADRLDEASVALRNLEALAGAVAQFVVDTTFDGRPRYGAHGTLGRVSAIVERFKKFDDDRALLRALLTDLE